MCTLFLLCTFILVIIKTEGFGLFDTRDYDGTPIYNTNTKQNKIQDENSIILKKRSNEIEMMKDTNTLQTKEKKRKMSTYIFNKVKTTLDEISYKLSFFRTNDPN